MADPKHVATLRRGVSEWNSWRDRNPGVVPELSDADLARLRLPDCNLADGNLAGASLRLADLSLGRLARADLSGADLSGADMGSVPLLMREDSSPSPAQVGQLLGQQDFQADLSAAKLRGATLSRTALTGANLSGADLRGADLSRAQLDYAHAVGADLTRANLTMTQFANANLSDARLVDARLYGTDFGGTVFRGADLSRSRLSGTRFVDCHITGVTGLDVCRISGPCVVDHLTIARSPELSVDFLKRAGVPDLLIEHLELLRGDPLIYHSVFISYGSEDRGFAQHLHTNLQGTGVRCWFAPEDMRGGEYLHEQINQALHFHDRVLLLLSPTSIGKPWVQHEVRRTLLRERDEERRILFPLRLTSYADISQREWMDGKFGGDLSEEICKYYIPDFSSWKEHDSFQLEFDKLLDALKTE